MRRFRWRASNLDKWALKVAAETFARRLATAVHPWRRSGGGGIGEVGFHPYFDRKKLRALAKHHGYTHVPICRVCTVWPAADAAGGAATRPLLVGLWPSRSGSLRLPPSGRLMGT